MSAALMTLVCLIFRYCITTYVIQKHKPSGKDVGYFISFLIQAITVVVVSVPEGELIFDCFSLCLYTSWRYFTRFIGLPLAVTLALAYAVRVSSNQHGQTRSGSVCFPSFRK